MGENYNHRRTEIAQGAGYGFTNCKFPGATGFPETNVRPECLTSAGI